MFSTCRLWSCLLLGVFIVTAYQLPYRIPGPRSLDDKIAVIGAGPSGIHMAYMLQEKGFRNVEILEKTSRLGGKSQSIEYRGAIQELGTVYLSPDYYIMRELSEKYVPNDIVPFPAASVWLDNMTAPIDFTKYAAGFIMKTLGLSNPKQVYAEIFKTLEQYQQLHLELFGEYTGEIMSEPNKETMFKIRGTFLEFIMRNKLQALIPLFQASTTVQGYGHLDEVSALYGLMWNTPNFINGFKERLEGKGYGNMNILKSGFQNLWQVMVRRENIKVTYDVKILKVYRPVTQLYVDNKQSGYIKNSCREVWICKQTGNRALPRWERYNFVVWSPEMKESLSVWQQLTTQEEKLFSRTEAAFFTSSIVNMTDTIRGQSPIDYFLDNMVKKRQHSVWAQRDSYAVINQLSGLNYQNGKFPMGDDGKSTRTCVAYQMGKQRASEKYLSKVLKKHVHEIGGKNVQVERLKTWRYFPRYSPDQMEQGVLWRILEMQGRFNMWYIGSSVCFESVKSVTEYNKLIIENMEPIP